MTGHVPCLLVKTRHRDELRTKRVKIQFSAALQHSVYQVSALSLDPSGARLVSGGYEFDVKFWDFAGMDSSLRSFRTITPCERYTVVISAAE